MRRHSSRAGSTGSTKVVLRIRDLYVAHVLVLIVGVAGLAVAASAFQNPVYFEHINLIPFNLDPAGAYRAPLYSSISPAISTSFPSICCCFCGCPLLIALMRIHGLLALSASALLWTACGLLRFNLPNYPGSYGWMFNPFAWQVLVHCSARLPRRAPTRQRNLPPKFKLAVLDCGRLCVMAFVVAAPWAQLPGLTMRGCAGFPHGSQQAISFDLEDCAHRRAWLHSRASWYPPHANWLSRSWAKLVINCGQHSLPIFCLSVVLSLAGFVILVEGGHGFILQTAVNAGGIALLGLTAWTLAQAKRSRQAASVGSMAPWLRPIRRRGHDNACSPPTQVAASRCKAPQELVRFKAPLRHLAAESRRTRRDIKIVALGSSSTAGRAPVAAQPAIPPASRRS